MGEESVFFMSDSTDGTTHRLKMPADGMAIYCPGNFRMAALQGWFAEQLLCLYHVGLHLC